MSELLQRRAVVRAARALPVTATAIGAIATMLLAATPAVAAPGLPVVSACTGASLPPSRLTSILTPLVTGIFTPLSGLPIVGPGLLAGVGGIVTGATSGAPIGLDVLTTTGAVLAPGSQCNQQASGFTLATDKGITIGGNSIDGLGATGLNANAGEVGSIALGNSAATAASATNSIAIGTGAQATVAGGVALGAGSIDRAAVPTGSAVIGGNPYTFAGATPASVVSVGAPGAERQIVNVAAGQLTAASTDAVNGSQLFATNTQVGLNSAAITTNTTNIANNSTAITNLTNGTAGPVQQTGVAGSLTLVAPGGTGAAPGAAQTLANVAPGTLAAGSTEAVNGGQLFATNANVTTNATAITNLTTGITGGTLGLVQQTGGSPGTGAITVGAATGGTSLNVAGTTGNRVISGVAAGVAPTDAANVGQLGAATANAVQYDDATKAIVTLGGVGAATPTVVTNVAAGALTPTSTDAVNGGQLFATNTNVATNTTNIAGNTTAITNLTNGTAGLVQQATPTSPVTVAAANGGTSVDFTGTAGARTLSGVAPGVAATDAVDVGQVGSLIGASAAAAPIQYSAAGAPTTPTPGVVSNDTTLVGLAAGTPVGLHNVAAGVVVAGSTDAVNGGQLFATNANVTTNATNIATNTANIAGNTTAITNLTTGITGGTLGLVQQTGGSPGTGAITVGAATGGTSLNVAGTAGNRVISGVAAGVAPTDAANVGQISAAVGTATANAVQYDTAGGVRTNSITLAGGAAGPVTVTNVAAGRADADLDRRGQRQPARRDQYNGRGEHDGDHQSDQRHRRPARADRHRQPPDPRRPRRDRRGTRRGAGARQRRGGYGGDRRGQPRAGRVADRGLVGGGAAPVFGRGRPDDADARRGVERYHARRPYRGCAGCAAQRRSGDGVDNLDRRGQRQSARRNQRLGRRQHDQHCDQHRQHRDEHGQYRRQHDGDHQPDQRHRRPGPADRRRAGNGADHGRRGERRNERDDRRHRRQPDADRPRRRHRRQ